MRAQRSTILASLIACLVAGCSGGGGGESFGLARRIEVRGLRFPTGLPEPASLRAVPAFPRLGFVQPLAFVVPPDGSDRAFVVEQRGLIHVFADDPDVATTRIALDLTGDVVAGGEEGLLGFAFHPEHATNGLCYVYYSAADPRRSVLARLRVDPADRDRIDPASREVLLEIPQPFANHNGGCLAFGPDGMLYVAVGDGGSGNDPFDHGQDPTTLLGAILRLDPDGRVPPDNPFVGATGGERPEIWATGLRNPWRMSFDRGTGELWVGDVGQGLEEEIDLVRRGDNLGWRVYEGWRSNLNPANLPPTAFTQPVHSYGRELGASVTGGYVYRGSALPSLVGVYVYADFASGRVWGLVHDGSRAVSNVELAQVANPASFGEDAAGELYVCSYDGRIYRFEEAAGGGEPGVVPDLLSTTGLFTDLATLTAAPGIVEYTVNAEFWSDGAAKRRWIALPGRSTIGFSAYGSWSFPVGTVLVKHFAIDIAPGVTKRLETRVLVHHAAGWRGYTYRWRADGSDADLLADGAREDFEIVAVDGSRRTLTWEYPSRSDCLRCHTTAAGHVLGVRTAQLRRDFDFALRRDDQLRAWNHIGMFDTDIGPVDVYPPLARPDDPSAPPAARARAWLDTNCAMCHRPGGPTPLDLDLRAASPDAAMRAIGVAAIHAFDGRIDALRIDPGSAERSELWQRVVRRGVSQMPPLGSSAVDDAGAALLRAWIDALPPR